MSPATRPIPPSGGSRSSGTTQVTHVDVAPDIELWLHAARDDAGGASGTGRAPVLLLPGAAGDAAQPGLVALAESLAEAGHACVRARWPHHHGGRRGAPAAERALDPFVRVLDAARVALAPGASGASARPWIVGGRSYGARVASMAVARGLIGPPGVVGLLLVSYPLRPPARAGRGTEPRVAHWGDITVPVLLLHGTRDRFWHEGDLDAHVGGLAGPVAHVSITGGDHDLRVGARQAADGRARDPGEAVSEVAPAVVAWAGGLGSAAGG